MPRQYGSSLIKDIYVAAVYLWSNNSPTVTVIDADVFVCLHSDIEIFFI